MRLSSKFTEGASVQVNTASGWLDAIISERKDLGRRTAILVVFADGSSWWVAPDQGIRLT